MTCRVLGRTLPGVTRPPFTVTRSPLTFRCGLWSTSSGCIKSCPAGLVSSAHALHISRRSLFLPTSLRRNGSDTHTNSSSAHVGKAEDPATDYSVPEGSVAQVKIGGLIKEICDRSLKPYDSTFHFLADTAHTAPMVMFLGNHSSGKSTLINHICGREIQKTGVAPTDDGFTVISRAQSDMNVDGPTTVNDPQYEFQTLQAFGFNFINRFRMKVRKMPASSKVSTDLILVDTPGMIDTPVHVKDRTSLDGQLRGYDFLSVTRWFAQRSDVILLMFDPANPGTTGETLDVLTKSLYGLEHKFILVLNKVDMFEKVTDFARAYGTLCWNLSKVIEMKDIPQIYTTFTPRTTSTQSADHKVVADAAGEPTEPSKTVVTSVLSREESGRQRDEVIEEILAAPIRRLDNMVTETEESARCVLLAAQVCNALRSEFRQRELLLYCSFAMLCLFGTFACFGLLSMSLTATVLSTIAFVAIGSAGVVLLRQHLRTFQKTLISTCDDFFDRLHTGKLRTKDAELRWFTRVKPEILRVSQGAFDSNENGITALPATSSRGCRRIAAVIKEELPALRTAVSTVKKEEARKRWGDRSSLL